MIHDIIGTAITRLPVSNAARIGHGASVLLAFPAKDRVPGDTLFARLGLGM